eukprot:Hpha_TRINITY_DN16278_c0_g3::TRINITY_DN16278_c0_g3_i1::g.12421::m.12421
MTSEADGAGTATPSRKRAASPVPATQVKAGWARGTARGAAALSELLRHSDFTPRFGASAPLDPKVAHLLSLVRFSAGDTQGSAPPFWNGTLPVPEGHGGAAPPVQLLGSGLSFPTVLRWSPAIFGEARDPRRCLLAQGHREPQEVLPRAVRGNNGETGIQHGWFSPEQNRAEVEALGHVVQLWNVPQPPGPTGAPAKQAPPSVRLLGLGTPRAQVEGTGGLSDIRWLEGQDEVEYAQRVLGYQLATPERAGVVCAVSRTGQVFVCPVPPPDSPELPPPPSVTPLTSLIKAVTPSEVGYSACTWHVRWGEVVVFAGTVTGDVEWWQLTPDKAGPKLVLVTCLRAHTCGFVSSLSILSAFTALAQDVGVGSETEGVYDTMRVGAGEATVSEGPGVPEGAEVHDVLVSATPSQKDLCAWHIGVFPARPAGKDLHLSVGPLSDVLASGGVPCIATTPYGSLLIGGHDGSVQLVVLSQTRTYLPMDIKPAMGQQHGITAVSCGVCTRGLAEDPDAGYTDSMLLYSTCQGAAGLLRWPRRALRSAGGAGHALPGQTIKCRRCSVSPYSLTSSFYLRNRLCSDLGHSAGTPRAPVRSLTEDLSLLLCRNVRWTLPNGPGERVEVTIDLKLAPSAEDCGQHDRESGTMGSLLTHGDTTTCALASGGSTGAHLAAIALPGGLIAVLPL